MSPAEAAARMRDLRDNAWRDEEEAHIKADQLLCDLLAELGYGETVDAYLEMTRWFA